jgi:ribulose-5-phosphate 4-epimerase/fuculose-1-phosphate aldolase
MLITPATDLATVTESTIVKVPLAASALPAGAPAEGWAHLALYRARPGTAAIARAQPASALAAAATTTSLPVLHGQAAWLGESIPVHDSATLLRSPELAEDAARSLPAGEALLLRGNGALTLGATPGLAVARMWLLSVACDAFLAARAAGRVKALSAAEIRSWRTVCDEMLPRLWQHLRHRAHQRAHGAASPHS